MTADELAALRTIAERARIGDEIVFAANGHATMGEVRMLEMRHFMASSITIEIGIPRSVRVLLNLPEPPRHAAFTLTAQWPGGMRG